MPDAEKEVDTDADGMPDSWEGKYNLDPEDPADAALDFDEDGLTNYDEYVYGTDPTNKDTDGDSASDKKEIDAGTNPNDPNDKPGSTLILILIILLILICLGAIGYVVYTQYYKRKPMPARPITPMYRPMPVQQPRPAMGKGPHADRVKQRMGVFDKFKPEEKKPEVKQEQAAAPEKKAEGRPSPDVFRKLSTLIDSTRKGDSLHAVASQAAQEVRENMQQHADALDSKLASIEKKVKVIAEPEEVYVTKAGSKYHTRGCMVIKGQCLLH